MTAAVYNAADNFLTDALSTACNQNCFSCEVKHDKCLLYSFPSILRKGSLSLFCWGTALPAKSGFSIDKQLTINLLPKIIALQASKKYGIIA